MVRHYILSSNILTSSVGKNTWHIHFLYCEAAVMAARKAFPNSHIYQRGVYALLADQFRMREGQIVYCSSRESSTNKLRFSTTDSPSSNLLNHVYDSFITLFITEAQIVGCSNKGKQHEQMGYK